jgi:hypothetical protein
LDEEAGKIIPLKMISNKRLHINQPIFFEPSVVAFIEEMQQNLDSG